MAYVPDELSKRFEPTPEPALLAISIYAPRNGEPDSKMRSLLFQISIVTLPPFN